MVTLSLTGYSDGTVKEIVTGLPGMGFHYL